MKFIFLVFLCSFFYFNTAQAETFFGAGGGYSNFSIDYVSTPSFEFEDKATSGKAFIGYEFDNLKGFAKFEVSYDSYGDWSPNNQKDTLSSFSLTWTPSIEIADGTFIAARLGTSRWNSDISSKNKVIESQGGNGVEVFYGISFETPLVDKLSIRIDYDIHDIDYVQFNTFTMLLTLNF